MTQLKILISGGGIAGNALAFWLARADHDVTVIERFSGLRVSGLQVDLRGHGVEVLRRMGLEQAFRFHSAPEQGWQLVDSSGRRCAYFPANKSGKGGQSFTSEYEIMRGDFVRILYEANQDRVKYLFGTSIESFTNGHSSVGVRFADGKTDHFDLLVGADGQWSRTRRMMLGLDTADPLYFIDDTCVAYFTMPRPIKEGEQYIATSYMSPGKRGILMRRSDPDKIQIYLGCNATSGPLKDIRRGDVDAQKDAMADVFRNAGWQTEEILQGLKVTDDFYCERLGLVKLPSWHERRVVLLGDAAYCPSANTGMGTTSAIVGAYVLAGEINTYCRISQNERHPPGTGTSDSLVAALEAYDQKFRPFMDQVQKGVLEDKGFMPATSFGIAVFNFLAGLASLLKLDVTSWVLKEKIKNWNLPEYQDMLQRID